MRKDVANERAAKIVGKRKNTARKAPYAPPRLEALGDLRTATLGASPGVGESVGGQIRKSGVG